MKPSKETTRAEDAAAIRKTIAALIKRCGLSREQIADEMTKRLGERISVVMLNKLLAESRNDYRWPAQFDIAFCEVIGDYTLLAERAKRAGFRMVGREEERLIVIGRAWEQKRRAEKILAGGGQ
jgi:hypothetical protein